MSLHRVIVLYYRYLTRIVEITVLEFTASRLLPSETDESIANRLSNASQKIKFKSCVPACTRANLIGLKLRRYG